MSLLIGLLILCLVMAITLIKDDYIDSTYWIIDSHYKRDILYYYSKAPNGTICFESEYLVAGVLQPTQDYLSYGGEIFIVGQNGSKCWDSTFNMSSSGIILRSDTFIFYNNITGFKAVDNLNADLFYITGLKCKIRDFSIDGNRDNQVSGSGFNIYASTSADLHLDNVYITYCKQWGINMVYCGNSLFSNVYIEYSGSDGIIILGSIRNTFMGVGCWGNSGYGWFIIGSYNKYIGCMSYGNSKAGWVLQDSSYGIYSACHAIENYWDGFWIYGNSDFNRFSACASADNSKSANNAYQGVKISGYSTKYANYNQCEFTVTNTVANKCAYGIYEADTNQDYNIYYNCVCTNAVTANIVLKGANSQISAGCYNGTTYIPAY